MLEVIGWIGATCFAICAVPQALQSYRTGSSEGVNMTFLLLWIIGEILTLVYILGTTVQLPLIFNYIVNLICLAIIIWYKIPQQLRKEG